MANVQLGDSVVKDVDDSFFITMNNQTEMFAKIVQKVRDVLAFIYGWDIFFIHGLMLYVYIIGCTISTWIQCSGILSSKKVCLWC